MAVFKMFFLKMGLKSKNTNHKECTLMVSRSWYRLRGCDTFNP
jgi:hypothetical protein